eukprot:gb/GECG01000681.1/.p1 GENE.gb/GECG01000681.1/~~gb/GECG01000681.1/.p1  ORF type:complete len:632 (+),score=68.81 gb/GECG01000681.1/:1-1896(+)
MHLIMEFCDGGDVAGLIKRHGRFKESQVKPIIKQLASGVAFLRENSLIHRDLKPQNLLLSGRYPSCTLKIADFGFARSLQQLDMAETLCGSPLYMAPEILNGKRYDAKCDLWSVGAIMFELVTGRPPYNGTNHMDLIHNINQNPVKMDSEIKRQLSKECLDLIRGLLRKNPKDRISFEDFWNSPFIKDADSVIPDPARQEKDRKSRTIERLEKADGTATGSHASPLLSPEQSSMEQQSIPSLTLDKSGAQQKSSLPKSQAVVTEEQEKPRRRSLYNNAIAAVTKMDALSHDGQWGPNSIVERLSTITVGNIITVAEDRRSLFESSSFKANAEISQSFLEAILDGVNEGKSSETPLKADVFLQNAHVRIARHSAFCARAIMSLAEKYENIARASPNHAIELLTKRAHGEAPVDVPRLAGKPTTRRATLSSANVMSEAAKQSSTMTEFDECAEEVHRNAALCALLLYSRSLRLLNHCTSYFAHLLTTWNGALALLRPTIQWLTVSIASANTRVENLSSEYFNSAVSKDQLLVSKLDTEWLLCKRAAVLLRYADTICTCENFGRAFFGVYSDCPVEQACLNFRLEAIELLHSMMLPRSVTDAGEEKLKEVALSMEEKARHQIQKARDALHEAHQ